MRNYLLASVLFAAGFGFGWLFAAMHAQHVESARSLGTNAQSTAGSHVGTDLSASSERPVPRDPQQQIVADATDPSELSRSSSAVPVESFGAVGDQVGTRGSVETGVADIERKATAPWESPSVEPKRLLEAASITCEFGAGLTGSARSLPNSRFEYQGSPIGFDTFDMAAATARMTGNIVGSTYETQVRLHTTPGALHFSGTLSGGNFVLITVFGLVANDLGDYAAIMTMHNQKPAGLHTQINSGNCH